MRLSRYFEELSSSYAYEIEDLTYDSGGTNVLSARLRTKREQFGDLLAMSESFPVMVVPAFRGGFRFGERAAFERLIASEPEDFPAWGSLCKSLEMEPWAESLARRALQGPGGERFMVVAAALEYLQSRDATPGPAVAEAEADVGSGKARRGSDEDDGDEDDAEDLADAGEDYLSEVGFDRRS